MKENYIPMTSEMGIMGTSYRLQLGSMNDYVVSILLKGKEIIAFKSFKNMKITDTINQNLITAWVLQVISIPLINTHQIARTVQVLTKQLIKKRENNK